MLGDGTRSWRSSSRSSLGVLRNYDLFEDVTDSMEPWHVFGPTARRQKDGSKAGPVRDFVEGLFTGKRAEGTRVEDGERFNPYEDNSGTTICLKQDGFIVVAGDTRHSSDMVINSREMSKIFRIGDFLLSGTGFYADSHEVYVKMVYEMRQYEIEGPMSIHSAANLLSKTLYSRRFFPLYSYCALSGFDGGEPYIYAYDPLGSFKPVTCICNGSGRAMIQPLLDSFIDKKNWNNAERAPISQEDCIRLVAKAFGAAAERDVKTKDNLEIYVMSENDLVHRVIPLRRD